MRSHITSVKHSRIGGIKKSLMAVGLAVSSIMTSCYGYSEEKISDDSSAIVDDSSDFVCVLENDFEGKAIVRVDGNERYVKDSLTLGDYSYHISFVDDGYMVLSSPHGNHVMSYLGSEIIDGHQVDWVDYSTDLKAYYSRALLELNGYLRIVGEGDPIKLKEYTLRVSNIELWDVGGPVVHFNVESNDGVNYAPIELKPGSEFTIDDAVISLKDVSMDSYSREDLDACVWLDPIAVLYIDDRVYYTFSEAGIFEWEGEEILVERIFDGLNSRVVSGSIRSGDYMDTFVLVNDEPYVYKIGSSEHSLRLYNIFFSKSNQ